MPQVLDVLMSRRSERHFARRAVAPDVIECLIEAFRWAPSPNNRQPWRLLIAKSPEAIRAFDHALTPDNRAWAAAAAVKMVVIGNPDEQPARNGLQYFMLDCGLALENMLIQGCAMGLTIHAMVGWDAEKVSQGFRIPLPLRPVALVAAGYRGRLEDLPEELQAKERRPRTRKAVKDIVVCDFFAETADRPV
jgi:nitroreductase